MSPGIGGFFVFPQRRFRGSQVLPGLSFQRRKVTLRVCNQRGQCPTGAPTPFELAPSSPQRYRFTAHHTGHAHSEPPIGMCSWCFLSGLRLRLAGGGEGSASPTSPYGELYAGGWPIPPTKSHPPPVWLRLYLHHNIRPHPLSLRLSSAGSVRKFDL